jgi:hypothetical protein
MTVRAYNHWDSSTPWKYSWYGGTGAPATYSVELAEITGGTVSANSIYSTSGPEFARDKTANEWHSLNTSVNPWIKLDFGTTKTVSRMTIQQRTSTVHWFKDVLIEYSADDSVWIPVYRLRVDSPAASVVHTVEFEPAAGRYWRLRMTGLNSTADWYFVVQEWALYGASPLVSRFVRSTNELVGLIIPGMGGLGVGNGTKVFFRGEYRTNQVGTLGGNGTTSTGDAHTTVGDQVWHPFQCSVLVENDWASLWSNDPAFGWIEFRNVVVDTAPMAMGWDGTTWKFITDTWDGNQWRGDSEIWDGKQWRKMWESRTDPGGETWSAWMEVKSVGAAGAAPIAVFAPGWANYGDGNWATAKWRYSNLGRVECYGLVRATQVFSPASAAIVNFTLPTVAGFAPRGYSSLAMNQCMSSHAPAPGTSTSMMRVDLVTSGATTFYLAMIPNGSASNVNNGDWIGLNVRVDITQGDHA